MHVDLRPITFAQDSSFVRNDQGESTSFRRTESSVERLLDLDHIDLFGPWVTGEYVSHGPRRRHGRWKSPLYVRRREVHGILADGVRHAPLVLVHLRGASDTVRQGETHLLPLEIDHRVHHVSPFIERTRQAAHVCCGIRRVETRDEHGRAQGLREA